MSNDFWLKNSKLSARIQFLQSKEVPQPPQVSYFYHFKYVQFIVERTDLIIVPCTWIIKITNYGR